MPRFLLTTCLLGAAVSALAQIGAPQSGWVPDSGRLRPVYGMPAAAVVGAPISADQNFSQIAASQARNYVLMSAADTGAVFVYASERGLIPLEGAGSAPDTIVLSPAGSSAALWFAPLHRLQIITGLPGEPQIRETDVPFSEPAAALAVSDDGSWIAGVWNSGTYALGPNGEVNRLPIENATAVVFFSGTHNLASAGPGGLQMVTGADGFAVISNLLTSADASLQPVAVAATSDSRTVVLAERNGSVTAIDIASAAASVSDCGCQPEGLFAIGRSAFRLTGLSGGSFKLFDAASAEILFAPLALAETEGAGQ